MNLIPDQLTKKYGGLTSSNITINGDAEAKQQAVLVEWLLSIHPNLDLRVKASEEELRACLIDGTVLCRTLNRLRPGLLNEGGHSDHLSVSRSEYVKKFLASMDELGIPRFERSDLEKGSMKPVIGCLLTLKAQFMSAGDSSSPSSTISKSGSPLGDASSRSPFSPLSGEERHKILSESKFQRARALRTPAQSVPSAAAKHHVGHNFHEVFQMKQGRYADLPAAKISEMMKSNSLDNAPTQSLLSVVNGILDESVEKKNSEMPHRVACLLRKVMQEIERRISTQAEHLRTQNNLFKTREEKYQSRIRVLEALASGTGEETKIPMNQLQQIKTEKAKIEERKKLEQEDMVKLMKEKDQNNFEISALKQELEMAKKTYELRCLQMETEAKVAKAVIEESKIEERKKLEQKDMVKLMKERDQNNIEISALKRELEMVKKTYELRCLQKETEAKVAKDGLEERVKDLEHTLVDWRNKVKELEENSESKYQNWNQKETIYRRFIDFQFGALQELRFYSESIKQEILTAEKSYSEESNRLGRKLIALAADAAKNYHTVLAENRKLFNDLQELKGNIRVYCRIRPFLPGQTGKRSTIEYISENGELVVANPSKPGKDGHRMFKFNKVFGPAATQAEVFSDTQPLIRSVLDGYSVCIFAYGQTGSGKTHTMTGPTGASEEDWGVNYRALNDLFDISQSRKSSITYEIGVQMVEIYNEQVRDLLSNDSSQKKLGIKSTTQPNGLAVPDASMQPVTSTSHVMKLMDTGLKNRAVGATAMNERSSRSHSVVTIHVRGKDLKTGSALHGNLHLVDLAGSERVDRSEVTGDRLREAQHINKSLSALGDVIFALAQKSSHIPYRNSKLTQLLQSSLGGQAKTLMFVQLNPDINSYSETASTLKFAERVSGVELGAARSSKEGRDVRELMEQVASLKDTIGKKDGEIERLQLLKDLKNVYPSVNEKLRAGSLRYESSTASKDSVGAIPQRSQKPLSGKGLGQTEKAALDHDNCSEYSDKRSEADSQQSWDDIRHQNELLRQSKVSRGDIGHADAEILGLGEAEYDERLSDISDGSLSVGTEPDGSAEYARGTKPSDNLNKTKPASKITRHPQKVEQTSSTTVSVSKDSTKVSPRIKKTVSSSSLLKPPRQWQ